LNIPKLRFKEFTDEWKHYSLDDIISISSKKYNPLTSNINYPCIELESILSNSGTIINTFDSLNQKSIKNVFKENDILFGKLRPYLKKYWYAKFNGVCSSEIWVLNNKLGLNKYLYYLIQTNKFNLIANNSTGSKMPRADWQFIKSQKFYISNMLEQEKIANFLTTVDKKITNLENTITNLENQKKGLLQQIFSQKLRFKDENGNNYPNWINSTIGKSGYFYYGKSAPKWSITDTATIPCVRYGELYTTHNIMVKKIYSYTNIPKENLKFSTGNEVLVPRVGEEPLDFCKCCYLPFKDVAIGEMISVYNTKNNPLFISYMFNATMKYKFAKLVEGGNVSNLYYSYLENIKIKLPCLEEQTKIADFLSAFDRKLDNQKAQLEHWKQIKKGLLQQMFV